VRTPKIIWQRIPPDNPENLGLELFLLRDGSYFPVAEALEKRYDGLMNKDSPVLVEVGPTANTRFEWPGYPSKEYQLRTVDWHDPPRKITLGKLSTEVAKHVTRFVEDMEGIQIDPNHASWRVGQGGIRIEDLRLAAYEQVSTGSWQVRLFYTPPH